MSERFNYWDILIGVGYGVSITLWVLRLLELVPNPVAIWAMTAFVCAVALQISRQIKQNARVASEEIENG